MNQSQPLVSIITPSYNQAEFLEITIQSVLGQSYPNIEYIIIDGGSQDGSLDIIQRYQDRLAYWHSRKDGGQAEAINWGLQKATGKYVAWLNSDDVYLPDCVEKAVAVLEADSSIAMAYGRVEVINAHGDHLAYFRPVVARFEDLLCYEAIIPQQAAFFRSSVLHKVGFLNQDLHFVLDHELFLRFLFQGRVAGFPDVVAQYRISSVNKGSRQREMWSQELVQILDDFFARPNLSSQYKNLLDDAYAGAYYRGACNFLDVGSYPQARSWFLTALKHKKSYIFRLGWWRSFLRTWIGLKGNQYYLAAKYFFARAGMINIQYDWWTALYLKEKGRKG